MSLGIAKGPRPFIFIPALTNKADCRAAARADVLGTCASKRIKAEGFCTRRALAPGNAQRSGQSAQPQKSGGAGFLKD